MSQVPTPTDQEVTLGIPYLSPVLNKGETFNINNKKQQKKEENEEKSQKNKKNISSPAISHAEKEKKNNSSSTGKKRSASTSIRIGEDDALIALNIANKEYLDIQQVEFVTKFSEYQKRINCSKCNSAWINVDRIDHIEIEHEEYAEIILSCKKCAQKYNMEEIQNLISKLTKEKRRQLEDKTEAGEEKIEKNIFSEHIQAVISQFDLNRDNLSCIKCNKLGSLQKNGSNQGKPPKPQYKCKHCNKGTTFDEMKTILKYHTSSSSTNNEMEVEIEESDFEKDDENEIDETSDVEMDEEVQEEEVEQHFDIKTELRMLKKRIEKNEKETKKMQQLMRDNINLKKENRELKKRIGEMEKEKEIQKKYIMEKEKTNKKEKGKEKEKIKESNMEEEVVEESSSTNIGKNNQQQQQENINMNSQKDFPYLQASLSNAHKQQNNNSKNNNINNYNWTKNKRNQFFRRNNPSKKQLELATRTFEEKTEENNFINIYLPCKRRMKPSEIRRKLAFVGIDNIQVLDTYCPDWDTVLLLIHEKYKEAVEKKLDQAGIHTKEYNYLHISHLRDTRLAGLSREDKIKKLEQIRNNCTMRALEFIRDPVKKSVARCFHRQNLISDDQLKQVLTGKNMNEAMEIFREPEVDAIEKESETSPEIENQGIDETQTNNETII